MGGPENAEPCKTQNSKLGKEKVQGGAVAIVGVAARFGKWDSTEGVKDFIFGGERQQAEAAMGLVGGAGGRGSAGVFCGGGAGAGGAVSDTAGGVSGDVAAAVADAGGGGGCV